VFRPGVVLLGITLLVAAPVSARDSGADPVPAPSVPAVPIAMEPAAPDGLAPAIDAAPSAAARRLRDLLRSTGFPEQFNDSKESRRVLRDVVHFYAERGYAPAWLASDGVFPLADDLLDAVSGAAANGLDPADYPVDTLRAAVHAGPDAAPAARIKTDVLLSHLLLTYARHLYQGRVDPADLKVLDWHVHRPPVDYPQVLAHALAAERVPESLDRLVPADPEYRNLLRLLARLREERGWPRVPGSFRAGLADRNPGVAAAREFLRAVGDLAPGPDPDPEVVDARMEDAVKAFQERHGLAPDGVVGPRTLAQMNVPVKERIRSVLLNLERRRWFPDALPDRYLIVNVPRFEVEVREHEQPVLTLRAIAGTKDNPTPSFSDEMEFVQLNPFWHVPEKIAREEILKKVREDSTYIGTEKFDVFDENGARVDPDAVTWNGVAEDSLKYRFRQAPGSRNPLGSIKFLFPNAFSVYMHDTPNRNLFDKALRAMSHGCIRIEEPLRLASYLLKDTGVWSGDSLRAAIDKGSRERITLPSPVPVYLTYFTAFTENNGKPGFREDVYDRDAALQKALSAYLSPYQRADTLMVANPPPPHPGER
jgi:murein L,D-transpeptidase YcbB/YkuD